MGQSPQYREKHAMIVERTIEAANEWVVRQGKMPTWEQLENSSGIAMQTMKNVFGLITSPIGIVLERRMVCSIQHAIARHERLDEQLITFTGHYLAYLEVMPMMTIESLAETWMTWLNVREESMSRIYELAVDLLQGVPLPDVERDEGELHLLIAS